MLKPGGRLAVSEIALKADPPHCSQCAGLCTEAHYGARSVKRESVKTIVRAMQPDDWEEVRRIYLEGIATENATFQTNAPEWTGWNNGHLAQCRFVAEQEGKLAGWVALSPVSERCVYSGVAEVSVYVGGSCRGSGVGGLLMGELISASEADGLWTLQSGIFPENVASISLHRRYGFREVGRRERLGQLKGVWRDVLLFERRSQKL